MEDLLPLCEPCHNAIEEVIKSGNMPRTGDPLFLLEKTLRILVAANCLKKQSPPPKIKMPSQVSVPEEPKPLRPHDRQLELSNNPEVMDAIENLDRNKFKEFLNRKGIQGKLRANAFTMYDRFKRKGCVLRTMRFRKVS